MRRGKPQYTASQERAKVFGDYEDAKAVFASLPKTKGWKREIIPV